MNDRPGIWVDADSCPRQVRDIIVRASERTGVPCRFIANRPVPFQESPAASLQVVEEDGPTTDDVILDECGPGDIVVTRDIPLAASLLERGCLVLNDRGGRFSEDTIQERLSVRRRMKEFREAGILQEKGRTFGRKEVHAFAAALDRELTALINRK